MKAVIRFGRWRPIVGVLALGVFAFTLTLEGAPKKEQDRSDRSVRVLDRTPDIDAAETPARPFEAVDRASIDAGNLKKSSEGVQLLRGGILPKGVDIPTVPAVQVDPFDDEPSRMRARGELVGPWRPRLISEMGTVAAGTPCQFNIECDDCNPCTQDVCDIAPFAASGTCLNNVIGDGGGINACSDGLFCNGIETCQSGVCELPGEGTGLSQNPEFQIPCNGVCAGGTRNGLRCDVGNGDGDCPLGSCVAAVCDESTNQCDLPCTQGRCDVGTPSPGAPCDTDAACGGATGSCLINDTACDDGLRCNGADTCNVGTGVCESEGNPCGPYSDCSELTCNNGLACNTDTDCSFGPCADNGQTGCFFGRCCTPIADGEFDCNVKRFETAPNGTAGQRCTGVDDLWSSTATGGLLLGNVECPVCSKYSAGVLPAPDDADGIVVVAGPISERTTAEGCAAGEVLFALGDSYELSNAGIPADDYMDLEELTFIGGVETVAEERILFEFYDASGNFIEDILFASGSGIARRTVTFTTPLRIPSTGRVIARVATAFSPSGKIFWATTTSPVQVGTNDGTSVFADFGAGIVTASNLIGECVGGTFEGAYCNPSNGNADCDPGAGGTAGTCELRDHVLAFDLAGEKAPEPLGACCNTDTGACDGNLPWLCTGTGGLYQGDGSLCSVCSNDSIDAGANCRTCDGDGTTFCVRDSDCVSNTCVATDLACGTCQGGSNDGTPCADSGACTGGGTCVGTCIPATGCATGACCAADGSCSSTDEGSCVGTFQGFGTTCDPNCCDQPSVTGADDCSGVTVVTFPSLLPGESATVTVTGDNSTATGPDSCTAAQFDPNEIGVEDVDTGWWEGWEYDFCHFMRVDMCCSVPVHAPQWVVMWDSCPCEASHCEGGSNDGTTCTSNADCTGGGICVAFEGYFNSEPPSSISDDEGPNNRGAPYCNDDNLWWWYGPLPPGKFYQPIFSALAGAHGPYQMHFNITRCPEAACCFLSCNGGLDDGEICEFNADCDAGDCAPTCELTDVLSCINAPNDPRQPGRNGIYQGPPFKTVPTTFCSASVCGTGSCCPAPGECVDEELGDPVSKADCDSLGGLYVGGIRCFGGTCSGGERDGLSCQDTDDCPLGSCVGTNDELAQPSPCPLCDIRDDAHCQQDPGEFAGTMYNSDSSVSFTDPDGQARVADDWVADESGALTELCVIGAYVSFDGGAHDCSTEFATSTPDDFRVRVFNNDPSGALPGTLLGDTQATVVARGVEFNDGGFDFFRHKLSLDTAIAGITQGNTYWIEVTDNTDVEPEACNWFWLNARENEGNNYFMQGLGEGFYGPVNAAVPPAGRPDIAFCLNLANSAPPEPMRACCSCDTGTCTDATFFECALEQKASWLFDTLECAALPAGECPADTVTVPSNDECGGAVALSDGANSVSNRCATDGSSSLVGTDCGGANPTQFRSDVWYTYNSTCDSNIEFAMCDLEVNGSQDTLMAIYSNGTSTCPCPVTSADQVGICSDDGCFWGGTGPSLNIANSAEDVCYLVRLAGFFDDDGAEWLDQKLDVTCGVSAACDAPIASSDGLEKSRYIGIQPGLCAGAASSLKVTVTSNAQHPSTVGDVWWASGLTAINNSPLGTLNAAKLQCRFCQGGLDDGDPCETDEQCDLNAPDDELGTCAVPGTPHSEVWPAGDLHLFGGAIRPGASYSVETCDAAGLNCSTPLVVNTGKWGDVIAPFGGGLQPGFGDINAIVAKFQDKATAPNMVSTDLRSAAGQAVDAQANFADVNADVAAFQQAPYPFATSTCP